MKHRLLIALVAVVVAISVLWLLVGRFTAETPSAERPSIMVQGDAERPGTYPFTDGLSSLPAMLAAAGVRMDAEGFVEVSREGNVSRYPLRRILINDPPLPKLQSGDFVRVSYKKE